KKEQVGFEREARRPRLIRQPHAARDRRDDRVDDQPENEQHRGRDEQEADIPPATPHPDDVVDRPVGQELGSTLGATWRYQPSLMASDQAPPGKTGIDCGMTSAK